MLGTVIQCQSLSGKKPIPICRSRNMNDSLEATKRTKAQIGAIEASIKDTVAGGQGRTLASSSTRGRQKFEQVNNGHMHATLMSCRSKQGAKRNSCKPAGSKAGKAMLCQGLCQAHASHDPAYFMTMVAEERAYRNEIRP
jgi:hypothetical protein